MIPAATMRCLMQQHEEEEREQLELYAKAQVSAAALESKEFKELIQSKTEKYVRDLHDAAASLADTLMQEVHWKMINNDAWLCKDGKYSMELYIPAQQLRGISSAVLLGALTLNDEESMLSIDGNVFNELQMQKLEKEWNASKSFLQNLGIKTVQERVAESLVPQGYEVSVSSKSLIAVNVGSSMLRITF